MLFRSLWDTFAGAALTGLLAEELSLPPATEAAKIAYDYANAMILERRARLGENRAPQ